MSFSDTEERESTLMNREFAPHSLECSQKWAENAPDYVVQAVRRELDGGDIRGVPSFVAL
jgi:hypothetical protein